MGCKECNGMGRLYLSYGDQMDEKLSDCPTCRPERDTTSHCPICEARAMQQATKGCPICAMRAQRGDKTELYQELVGAAEKLTKQIKIIHANDEYRGIWALAHTHGVGYSGPNYDKELENLEAELKKLGG